MPAVVAAPVTSSRAPNNQQCRVKATHTSNQNERQLGPGAPRRQAAAQGRGRQGGGGFHEGRLPRPQVRGPLLLCARPCRRFTPLLGVCYEDSKDVEIVFVSSDNDIDGFNEYYGEMGWAAIPFDDEDRRSALGERFDVSGIPALIILDAATGALVTKEGRAKVADKKALDGVFSA